MDDANQKSIVPPVSTGEGHRMQFLARNLTVLYEADRGRICILATATRQRASPDTRRGQTLPYRLRSRLTQLRQDGLPRIWIVHGTWVHSAPPRNAGEQITVTRACRATDWPRGASNTREDSLRYVHL